MTVQEVLYGSRSEADQVSKAALTVLQTCSLFLTYHTLHVTKWTTKRFV